MLLVLLHVSMSRADPVLEWTDRMIDAIRMDNSGPTISTRNLTLLHTAMYDAVNSVVGTHLPYRFQLAPSGEASAPAAAIAAGYEVFRTVYPGLVPLADSLRNRQLDDLPDDTARAAGVDLGREIAVRILAERAGDGSSTEIAYVPGSAPGDWRRTPPFFRPPLTPHWRSVRPFALPDIEPFLPPPPPSLDSVEYARALNEVKEIGGVQSAVRTPEQSLIAVFWSDFSYTSMPPGHWHLIAVGIARDRGNSLTENARLFALLSLAQADAGIVCWEVKYRYNLWRPVTAIQRAGEDGNDATEADPDWNHFLAAPPFPAYTSGHSTFSAASARVLTHFYGIDAITFTATSDSLPGVYRTFHSLAACADEVGRSRIYGGIHFQFDNTAGKSSGRKVGDYVASHYLLPIDQLPLVRFDRLDSGPMTMRVHGVPGSTLALKYSPDFRQWHSGGEAEAVLGGTVFTLEQDIGPMRFFQVEQLSELEP